MAKANQYQAQRIAEGQKDYIRIFSKIPIFHNDKNLDTIFPEQFLKKNYQLLAEGIVNNNNIMPRIKESLQGNAYQWFSALLFHEQEPKTYQDFKNVFATEFKVILIL